MCVCSQKIIAKTKSICFGKKKGDSQKKKNRNLTCSKINKAASSHFLETTKKSYIWVVSGFQQKLCSRLLQKQKKFLCSVDGQTVKEKKTKFFVLF
jgi:hypothetical protein